MQNPHNGIQRPNYFPFPNEAADEWLPLLSSSDFKALVAVLRQTLGWHRTSVALAGKRMEQLTGLSDKTARASLDALTAMGIIKPTTLQPNGQVYQLQFGSHGLAMAYLQGGKNYPPTDGQGGVKITPIETQDTNTTYWQPNSPLPLIEQYKSALRDALTVGSPPSFASNGKSLTPQQKAMGILLDAWGLLFGKGSLPNPGQVAQLIKLYGGWQTGAEWLLKEMFVLAANPPAGGPLRFLMDKGYGKGQYRNQSPTAPPTVRQEVTLPDATQLRPRFDASILDEQAA